VADPVATIQATLAPAFLISGALALLGGLALLPRSSPRAARFAVVIAGAAIALSGAQAAAASAAEPDPVVIADPCKDRDLPQTGALDGIVQDIALVGLDRAACEFGSSREELAIALVDDEAAARYEIEHGVDPRSITDLAGGVLGF